MLALLPAPELLDAAMSPPGADIAMGSAIGGGAEAVVDAVSSVEPPQPANPQTITQPAMAAARQHRLLDSAVCRFLFNEAIESYPPDRANRKPKWSSTILEPFPFRGRDRLIASSPHRFETSLSCRESDC
jgi:hypothetical protein